MNQIAKIGNQHPPAVSFEQQIRLAESFANSGLFGVKTTDQALALMALCEAEGLHPAIAIRDYHIIQGKPALKADAMLARFQAAGGKVSWDELSDKRVCGTFSHPQGGSATIDWSMERAAQAGLTGKDNYKKFPRQMLRARAISEGVRTVYPGVVVGVYTPEEVMDLDDRSAKNITPQPEDNTVKLESPRGTVQPYPAEDFDKNFPAWEQLIETGKKTADAIIAQVESKGSLTEEQKQKIRNVKVAEGVQA